MDRKIANQTFIAQKIWVNKRGRTKKQNHNIKIADEEKHITYIS